MAKLNKKIKKPKFSIYWIYVAVMILIVGWSIIGEKDKPAEGNRSMLETFIQNDKVEKVVLENKEIAKIYLTKEAIEELQTQEKYKDLPSTGVQFFYRIGSPVKFEEDFDKWQIDKEAKIDIVQEKSSSWTDYVGGAIPFILIIFVWIFIMRSMKGGSSGGSGNVFNVGKAKAQEFDKNKNGKVTFKDVAGLEEVKTEVMEIVDFLRNPAKYNNLGAKIPKGALLVGPPGTGKTLIAKAAAGEADVPFFSMSGSDFVEMFVGVGASRVRDLFKQAKEKAPCIVFIDEIDAIGRARSKNAGYSSNDERENTLNQLLTEMDGFGTNAGVIVLAATNRADILDKALMRAGRFDREIFVDLPEVSEREAIIKVHTKKLKIIKDIDFKFLALQTPGFSGADLANVCNEAALMAARKGKKEIDKQDFLDAVDRVVGGLENKSKVITQGEKKSIAYHEAGHAIVSWILEHTNPLIKVTIVPRGKALGAAWYQPEERQITTKEQLKQELAALLGGRASEELNFGDVSTGALNDLERATRQAYAMIAYYGMGGDKVKNLSYYNSTGQESFSKPYSEQTALEIDIESKAIIDEAYAKAKEVLTQQKDKVKELAELLLEKEVVFADDLERIVGKRTAFTRTQQIEAEKKEKEEKEKIKAEVVEETEVLAEEK
ncbi:MAG: ATP-dependent zinc metalloprotease FtsH [Bacteroidetes bacterium]|nr:ATP-dependent zinc metalloprotease FtsH [Bacteroidota bacterium]